MSDLDLSGLERAAALVGLGDLRARVVPFDARRGWWFRWDSGALLVSERVLERCPPGDAAALLVDAVYEQRRLRTWRVVWTCWWVFFGAFFALGTWGGPTVGYLSSGNVIALGVLGPGALVAMLVQRQQFRLKADDQAVVLLGDAESLVRALVAMGKDELHFGPVRLAARPDLHKRAERLVTRHKLCASGAADGGGADSGRDADD